MVNDGKRGEGRLTYDIVEAGRLLGLGRNAAYDAARSKQNPDDSDWPATVGAQGRTRPAAQGRGGPRRAMNAEKIAVALGEAMRSGSWWRSRCPVHQSASSTLAMRDGDFELVVKCHAGCPRDALLEELRRRGLLNDGGTARPTPDSEAVAERRAKEQRDRQFRTACALDFWRHETRPAEGTIVERYFRARGLWPVFPETIRASKTWVKHRESGGRWPVMMARIDHVEMGFTGVALTYLSPDGTGKASVDPVRRCIGPIGGGAVRLAPAGKTLLVSEGIENGLTAMQATGLPAWAALSTSGLVSLALPTVSHNVGAVIVCADNDLSGAGERAAHLAAARWTAEGRCVRIAMPPQPGSDLNDLLLGRGGPADGGS